MAGEELLIKYGNAYWRYVAASKTYETSIKRGPKGTPEDFAKIAELNAAVVESDVEKSLADAILESADQDSVYVGMLSSPPVGTIVRNGLLWNLSGDQLFVPNDPIIRTRILAHCHNDPTGAHIIRDKTLAAVQQRFRWGGLTSDVELYVSTCDLCQRNKLSQRLTPGALMPLPIPDHPCREWTNDMVTGIPTTRRGNDAIQVYVERLCKIKHFVACKKSDGAKDMAAMFVNTVVRQHGVPDVIISDRDPRFTGHYYTELTRLIGTEVRMSTARHPQSDGQSEREIKTLVTSLRSYCNDHQDDWDDYLDMLELGFNSAVQSSTQMSPYELLYGMKPRLPIDVAISSLSPINPAAADRAGRMQGAMAVARRNLATAQANQVRNARRRVAAFVVGESVMLSTDGISIVGVGNKLTARYVGPFKIVKIVNANAYTIELPPQLRALHPTFDIDKLKKYHVTTKFGTRPRQFFRPPPSVLADSNGDTTWEVERIMAQRYTGRRTQYLVRWKGYPVEESTWQSRADLEGASDALQDWDDRQLA